MHAASLKAIVALTRHDIPRMAGVAAVAAAAIVASLVIESSVGGVLAAGLVLVVVAIAVIDARSFIIPDELNAAGIVLGLAYVGATGWSITGDIAMAVLRGAILATAFLAIRIGYRRARGRDGLGLGDVKLAAMAGIWLDWTIIPVAIDIAAGSALAFYGLRQLSAGRGFRATERLPFGLFLAPAIWIGWVIDHWLFAGF